MRFLAHSDVAESRRDQVWWRLYRRRLKQASTEALVPGMGSQVQSGMSERESHMDLCLRATLSVRFLFKEPMPRHDRRPMNMG